MYGLNIRVYLFISMRLGSFKKSYNLILRQAVLVNFNLFINKKI